MRFTIPVTVISEANRASHEHWRYRQKRAQNQRFWGRTCMSREGAVPFPALVTLTRVGGRAMDDDNLAGAFKHVRDGIADALGVDDGDASKVSWRYGQRKGKPAGVEVEIVGNC